MRSHFIVLVALLLLATNPETGVSQSESRTISDFVVVSEETTNSSAIYIADQTTGAIYVFTSPIASTAAPNELRLASFSVFFLNPSELSAPSAITHHNGKLVVADSRQSAVFEIDTTTKTLSLLFKTQLKNLTRVAVSRSGRVAVSAGSGEILVYERSGKLSRLKQQFDNPVRLIFSGEDLVLLDRQGRIFLVQSTSTDALTTAITRVQIPTRVTGNLPPILDFAFLNGVYYLVGEKQVYAYLRSKAITVPLINRPTEAISLAAISANKREVVIRDQSRGALWKMQRPVAVTATFEASVGQSLVLLYQYLNSKKALPFKELTARRNYQSLKELLLEQRIILPEGAEMTSQLTELICQFNKGLCATPQAKTGLLDERVRRGDRLVLPDMPYREVVGYETKRLVNQSVQDYLDRTFKFNHELRSQFTPNVLWQLYDQKSQTLESRLQTNLPGALVASPPQGRVPPGTILKIAKDQDHIVSSLGKCEVDLRYSTKSVNLPTNIKSSVHGEVAITQLPRNSMQSATTRKLKQLEIDEVQFEIDEPVLEQGDPKGVSLAFSSTGITSHGATPAAAAAAVPGQSLARFARESRDCLLENMDSSTYLVIDALKVKRGRYKIFRNRSLLRLTEAEIEELQLLGKPDPSGEWSLIVETPYYVGYRLSKWSDPSVLESPMLRVEEYASELRPGGTQDIFAMRDTAFVLPSVNQWEVTFLISESELTDEGSDFNKLKSTQKFTALRAEETTRIAGSMKLASYQGSHDPPIDVVTRDRHRLKSEINFPTVNRDLKIAFGIGEKRCSVDKEHRDFKDEQGANAWMDEISSDGECAQPNRETTRKIKPASQIEETDHGTHVAGLIAARSNSIAPGLVPYAKLFLVDATSAATLNSSITRAVQRDVFIFNFSFGLAEESPDLRKAISTRWNNCLFVVAVDNSGDDLQYSRKPPVTWMDNIHDNMIGVASSIAAGGTQYVLGDWLSTQGLVKGSGYGKKYAHLVAPGHGIYSTLSGNTYGEATGTSHAAPQVTATAGLLFSSAEITEPARIKARLIYTSDWFEQLRGKVWGGFLNAKRAVWEPKHNIVITQSEREYVRAITLDPNSRETMKIKPDAQSYGAESEAPLTEGRDVPFADILRITLLPNNLYRVIYLDSDRRMKIVLNAQISGKFPCLEMEELKNNAFVASKCFEFGLDVTQVYDYVGQTPRKVSFTP